MIHTCHGVPAQAPTSVPSSSPSAVRRIYAGVACSDAGAISRFITIAHVTTRVRSLKPAACNAASNPMRLQDESSTYTHAATRSCPKSAKMKGATVEVGLAKRSTRQ